MSHARSASEEVVASKLDQSNNTQLKMSMTTQPLQNTMEARAEADIRDLQRDQQQLDDHYRAIQQ